MVYKILVMKVVVMIQIFIFQWMYVQYSYLYVLLQFGKMRHEWHDVRKRSIKTKEETFQPVERTR